MKIIALNESVYGEKRVAITPDSAKKLQSLGVVVAVESNCGLEANYHDEAYEKAGVKVSKISLELLADAGAVLFTNFSKKNDISEILQYLPSNSLIIGQLNPFDNKDNLSRLASHGYSMISLDLAPRITRAQGIDVLSSQSNLAGYKAVIEAANHFQKAMPMLMTAAGTIQPARVLVIGAGVAGLQAIATAKRLGAMVSAFDVRASSKEQVLSLGAKFIEVNVANEDLELNSGYAKEASKEYQEAQKNLIAQEAKKANIIITTALIAGKKAPILISKEMVDSMQDGSVIVDLAASQGGNCELTKLDQEFLYNKRVKIIGYQNIMNKISQSASDTYSRNMYNFIESIYNKETNEVKLKLDDEIIKSCLIAHSGKIINQQIIKHYENGK